MKYLNTKRKINHMQEKDKSHAKKLYQFMTDTEPAGDWTRQSTVVKDGGQWVVCSSYSVSADVDSRGSWLFQELSWKKEVGNTQLPKSLLKLAT